MIVCQQATEADILIDQRVLREFLELLGPEGPGLLYSIVDAYLNESPPLVEELGETLSHNDLSRAAWIAHRLKGSCLGLGANRLAARCANLEALCHAATPPSAATYAAVVADFTATRSALKLFVTDLR